jgi:hypothetical protein
VDQTIIVDQSQYLDVTNVQDNSTATYNDYNSTADVVTFADTGYGEAFVTEAAVGGEVLYVEQDVTAGGFYEMESQEDTGGAVYETDLGFQESEVCF